MCWSDTHQVECGDRGSTQGRRFVTGRLADALHVLAAGDHTADSELIYDAGIVTAELISNAARACREEVSVTLDIHHGWIRITVWDDGPGQPTPRTAGAGDLGGRGLRIVSALSLDWGTRPQGHGKTVWSTLSVPAGSSDHLDCHAPAPHTA